VQQRDTSFKDKKKCRNYLIIILFSTTIDNMSSKTNTQRKTMMNDMSTKEFISVCFDIFTEVLPENLDIILEKEDLITLQKRLLNVARSIENDPTITDSDIFLDRINTDVVYFLDDLDYDIIPPNMNNKKISFETVYGSCNPLENVFLSLMRHTQYNIYYMVVDYFKDRGNNIDSYPICF